MKAKRILRKEEIMDMDYLNFVVEASASSCQFGFIREREKNHEHKERANINVLIALPLGSGKTTNLLQIENAHLVNDVSFPGVVGTVTKDGEFVEGACIKAAGKVLLLDEFNRVPKDVKDALNNLLEQRAHPRNLGFRVRKNMTSNRKFCQIKIKGGYLYTRARFSCITSTMFLKVKEYKGKSMSDIAWFTRFIPVRFIPDIDYYEKLTKGEKILKVNPKVKEIDEFYFRDYLKAHKIYWDWMKNSPYFDYFKQNPYDRGALSRFLQDAVRLSAFVASLNNRKNIYLSDFESVMKFLPLMVSNYISYNLSEKEQKVLELLPLSQHEIAERLGISEPRVSQIVDKLRRRGLIR